MILQRILSFNPFASLLNGSYDDDDLHAHTSKWTWMTGVAITCLSLSVWNVLQKRPLTAMAISVGGTCLEIALMTLMPSRPSSQPVIKGQAPIVQPLIPSKQLMDSMDSLEKCYPVQVDPIRISNQQAGGMMGQACGDAIGLFTEFTTQAQAKSMMDGQPLNFGPTYPKNFRKGYNWSHIKRFVKNGWTDDTDQALSLVRAIYRKMKGSKKEQSSTLANLFARELMKWRQGGLQSADPFLGRKKPYCMGLGALVSSVLEEQSFLIDPLQSAEKVWAKDPEAPLNSRPAANGAIMRTAPIGLIFYHSLSDVLFYTVEACKVTHSDPRCTASSVAFTVAIALSIRGYECDDIFKAAEEIGLAVLRSELEQAATRQLLSSKESKDIGLLYSKYAQEFQDHLHGNWDTLDLDEGYKDPTKINKIGYTFKCMGAAFYALRLADQYRKQKKSDICRLVIEEIAAEGGDADTNAAAAGALVGAYLGYSKQFPENWTSNLADKQVLDQAIQHVERLSLLHEQSISKTKKT